MSGMPLSPQRLSEINSNRNAYAKAWAIRLEEPWQGESELLSLATVCAYDVPDLLSEVERLTAELDKVQVLVETCRAQDEECRRARRELNAHLPELDGEVPA